MSRERVGKYIKRVGSGIAACSLVAWAVDGAATTISADRAHPQITSLADKESAQKTIQQSEIALGSISVFVPEGIRSSLRITVESSTPIVTARKTINNYDQWLQNRSRYVAEKRGHREGFEVAGVIGGIIFAALGNVVGQGRRMWVTATSRG